jgi:hypothetical protein
MHALSELRYAWRRLPVNPLPRHLLQLEQEARGRQAFWLRHGLWQGDVLLLGLPLLLGAAFAIAAAPRGWLWAPALFAVLGLPAYVLQFCRLIFETVANVQQACAFTDAPRDEWDRPLFEGVHRLGGADVVLGLAAHLLPRLLHAALRAGLVNWLLLIGWSAQHNSLGLQASLASFLALGLPGIVLITAAGTLAGLILALYVLAQIGDVRQEPDYTLWLYCAALVQAGFTVSVLLHREELAAAVSPAAALVLALSGCVLAVAVLAAGFQLVRRPRLRVLDRIPGGPAVVSGALGVAVLTLAELLRPLAPELLARIGSQLGWAFGAFMLLNPLVLPANLLAAGGVHVAPGLGEWWRPLLLLALQAVLLVEMAGIAAQRVDGWRPRRGIPAPQPAEAQLPV